MSILGVRRCDRPRPLINRVMYYRIIIDGSDSETSESFWSHLLEYLPDRSTVQYLLCLYWSICSACIGVQYSICSACIGVQYSICSACIGVQYLLCLYWSICQSAMRAPALSRV